MSDVSLKAEEAPPVASQRLASIDAYRGFVMFLMMAEVLRLREVGRLFPKSWIWQQLSHHQEHVDWTGCSLHDMIQPSFSFLVGVALPFSLASRLAKGQSWWWMSLHAFWRALILSCLGIFLRSTGSSQSNFTFEDTLTQIGLGYGFLFLLALRPKRDQWIALGVILIGYWSAFAFYTPGKGFDFAEVGVPAKWEHLKSGFASHWNKNANPAWAFDTWFLNQFPRPGSELRLMNWGDGSEAPTSGKSLVVVGTDNNDQLHIRIFDGDGKRVTNTDESQLPAQSKKIEGLKRQLSELMPPHIVSDAEEAAGDRRGRIDRRSAHSRLEVSLQRRRVCHT